MIKLFKKLFAWIFGTKSVHKTLTRQEPLPISEKQELAQIEKEVRKNFKQSPANPKKAYVSRMRNNRLHIEYSGESLKNGQNAVFVDTFKPNGKFKRKIFHRAGSMYKGRIESLRCTKLKRAQEIVGRIERYCIERATFKDHTGMEFQII